MAESRCSTVSTFTSPLTNVVDIVVSPTFSARAGIALTSMFFARFGARLAHKLSPRLLKRLFAALLFCVGLSFLI